MSKNLAHQSSRSIKQAHIILVGVVLVTAGLYLIPQAHSLAFPLILLSTVAHELGHGVAALLVGGNFHSFHMFSDGSGYAQISGEFGGLSKAIVAAGGLVGPAIAAAFCFIGSINASLARIFVSIIGVALVVIEFLYVRNKRLIY